MTPLQSIGAWSFALAVLIFASIGLTRVELTTNNRVLFDKSQDQYAALLELEQRFGTSSEIVGLILCPTPCQKLQRAAEWLESNFAAISGVQFSYSAYSLDIPYLSTDGDLVSSKSSSDRCVSSEACSDSKSQWLDVLSGHLAHAPNTSTVVRAGIEIDVEDAGQVRSVALRLGEIKNAFQERYPELQIAITGAVPMMNAFYEASQSDFSRLGGLVFLVLAACLYVVLANSVVLLVALLQAVLSTVVAVGFVGLVGSTINVATSTVPLVVITLVVAASMHVYVDFLKDIGRPRSTKDRLEAAVYGNAKPLSLATLTSVFGLLSLLFVDSPALRSLGVCSAAGVVFGYLYLFTFVPLAFQRIKNITEVRVLESVRSVVKRVASPSSGLAGAVLVCAATISLAVVAVSRVGFDEDFVSYFSELNEFRVDTELFTSIAHSPYNIEIIVDVGENSSVLDPGFIESYSNAMRLIRAEPGVDSVLSILDPLRVVLDSLQVPWPSTVDEAEQDLLLLELMLQEGMRVDAYLDSERRIMRSTALVDDVSMSSLRERRDRFRNMISDSLQSTCSDCTVIVTGEGLASASLAVQGLKQLSFGLAICLFGFLLILWLYFHSLQVALIGVLAAIFPVVAGISILALLAGSFGLTTILVLSVTIGVVIDDVVHYIYRLHYAASILGLEPSEASEYAIYRAGPAILISSIALAAGFSCLVFSDFRLNQSFGLGVVAVVLFALAVAMFIVPKLLIFLPEIQSDRDVDASTKSVGQQW